MSDHQNVIDDGNYDSNLFPVGQNVVYPDPNPDPSPQVIAAEGDLCNQHKSPLAIL